MYWELLGGLPLARAKPTLEVRQLCDLGFVHPAVRKRSSRKSTSSTAQYNVYLPLWLRSIAFRHDRDFSKFPILLGNTPYLTVAPALSSAQEWASRSLSIHYYSVPQRRYTNVRLRCLGGLGARPQSQGVAFRFSCRVATRVAWSIS